MQPYRVVIFEIYIEKRLGFFYVVTKLPILIIQHVKMSGRPHRYRCGRSFHCVVGIGSSCYYGGRQASHAFFMSACNRDEQAKLYIIMEKTLKEQSFECLSNVPDLFDLKELLCTLKITPGQMGNMKGLLYLEGLTENQVRQKLSRSKIIKTNKFGVNSCLYYIFSEDVKGKTLCLFNGDKECFRALFFNSILLN